MENSLYKFNKCTFTFCYCDLKVYSSDIFYDVNLFFTLNYTLYYNYRHIYTVSLTKCDTEIYYRHRSDSSTSVQSREKIKRVKTAGSVVTNSKKRETFININHDINVHLEYYYWILFLLLSPTVS